MTEDEKYMSRAIKLAQKGAGWVSPNPMVGAVIVNEEGKIVAEAYHKRFGDLHAERAALKKLNFKAKGSTLYVNLEPCCHYGKTPPCTEAIIKAGIKKVVVGMLDPNPLVNGKGVEILKRHGIEIKTGVLEDKCKELNRAFIKWVTEKIPYVTLKWAQSIDGRIATRSGDSQWISSEKALRFAHKLRAIYDAVLVGKTTVEKDDPELTVRLVKGKNPIRIVLDTHLTLKSDRKIFKVPPETLVFTASNDKQKIEKLQKKGVKVFKISTIGDENYLNLKEMLKILGEMGISSLLVEGGGKVHTQFLKEGLADEINVVIAPIIIGEGKQAIYDLGVTVIKEALKLENTTFKKLGKDLLFVGKLSKLKAGGRT